MITNYVSIRSVLFDLSTIVDDRYYNEMTALEWAAQGLQKLRVSPKMEEKLYVTNIVDYKAAMPTDFKYLIQIAYRSDLSSTEGVIFTMPSVEDGSTITVNWDVVSPFSSLWRPLRLATTKATTTKNLINNDLAKCNNCEHTFSVSNSVISTSIKEACLLIFYKGYPLDEDGDILIPDNQDLKDALLNHVLYKYWLSRYMMKEDGAETRMKYHQHMYDVSSHKCKSLNAPDPTELENLSAIWNRIVPLSNRGENLFATLGNREHVNF